MNEIDGLLMRLRDAPVPSNLLKIDGAILAMVAHRKRDNVQRPAAAAAVMALIVGVAGSALPLTLVKAAPLLPFGAPAMLAPSTLLSN